MGNDVSVFVWETHDGRGEYVTEMNLTTLCKKDI